MARHPQGRNRRPRPRGERPQDRGHLGLLHLPFRERPAAPGASVAFEPAASASAPLVSGSLALLDEPRHQTTPHPVAVKRHILIVEDDPRAAAVLRDALELEGDPAWAIEIASEGVHALELAARTPPDLMLLDVWLPGLDGGEVYRRLRAGHATRHTRVLFLTAGTALDLYHCGIDDGVLLRKPYDVQELMGLVRALLAG
jgi:CheY-like chemotaxis protein